MKTALKFTALAVITTLLALACTPVAEMTNRDFSEYSDQFDAKYTNSNTNGAFPEVSSTLSYSSTADKDKELTISFSGKAQNADVLKKDNASILSELNSFFTLFQFSNPATTSSPGNGTPSIKAPM